MSNPDQSPANSPLQARALELHTKASMPLTQAEELALSELGIDDAAIDELSAEACCTVLLTLLDAEDVRAFTRAILVHQPAVTSTQRVAPTEAAAMAATVPAGWQMVPIHPTAEQRAAGARLGIGHDFSHECYRQMLLTAPQAPVADQPAEPSPAAMERAPRSNLPGWSECKLRVENSDFIAKRVAEGGHGADHEALLATELHRFIYEYDDTDAYKSDLFRHRLEKLLQETKAAAQPAELSSAATVTLSLRTAMLIRNVFLPANVRKMRSAAEETKAAAHEFINVVELASKAAPKGDSNG